MHVGARRQALTVHQFLQIVAANSVKICQNLLSMRRLAVSCRMIFLKVAVKTKKITISALKWSPLLDSWTIKMM